MEWQASSWHESSIPDMDVELVSGRTGKHELNPSSDIKARTEPHDVGKRPEEASPHIVP
jgi:hypothetical protein